MTGVDLELVHSVLSRRAWLQVLLPLGLVTLAVCFALGGHLGLRESVRYSLQGIALMPVFVAAVRYPDAPLFRPLNWAPVRHLGTLSYSLYLLHGVVINAFAQTTLSVPVRVACEMALSIAAAQTICWLIERPCARLRARLSTEEAVPADFAGGLAPTP